MVKIKLHINICLITYIYENFATFSFILSFLHIKSIKAVFFIYCKLFQQTKKRQIEKFTFLRDNKVNTDNKVIFSCYCTK